MRCVRLRGSEERAEPPLASRATRRGELPDGSFERPRPLKDDDRSEPREVRYDKVERLVGSEGARRMMGPSASVDVFADVCSREEPRVRSHVLEDALYLAVELAREGREGRKIGTIFVIGDEDRVLRHSRPLILDPLAGHPDETKRIGDSGFRETIKELALLDGAFVVSAQGVVISAARYIDVTARETIDIPLGLGSRHIAAANITQATNATAIVVSESSMVRVFAGGRIVSEVIPELWMLRNYAHGLLGQDVTEKRDRDITVVTRSEEEPS